VGPYFPKEICVRGRSADARRVALLITRNKIMNGDSQSATAKNDRVSSAVKERSEHCAILVLPGYYER